MNQDNYLLVGVVTSTFGIKGELKVQIVTSSPESRFKVGNSLYVKMNKHTYVLNKITSCRYHKGMALITFNDIYDINLVNDFIGKELYVNRSELDDLDDDEYYCDDLIGLKVYNQKDEYLGTVTDVIDVPSAAILEIINNDEKVLIPFVNEFIILIDDEKIVINEIEGLR